MKYTEVLFSTFYSVSMVRKVKIPQKLSAFIITSITNLFPRSRQNDLLPNSYYLNSTATALNPGFVYESFNPCIGHATACAQFTSLLNSAGNASPFFCSGSHHLITYFDDIKSNAYNIGILCPCRILASQRQGQSGLILAMPVAVEMGSFSLGDTLNATGLESSREEDARSCMFPSLQTDFSRGFCQSQFKGCSIFRKALVSQDINMDFVHVHFN